MPPSRPPHGRTHGDDMKKNLVPITLLAAALLTAPLLPVGPVNPTSARAKSQIHQQERERDGDPEDMSQDAPSNLGNNSVETPKGSGETQSWWTSIRVLLLGFLHFIGKLWADGTGRAGR